MVRSGCTGLRLGAHRANRTGRVDRRPKRRVEMTVWNASDGVRLRSGVATGHGPRVVKSTDGSLWYVTGDGVQVVDPRHLEFNKLPPPVHIEQVGAKGHPYQLKQGMCLSPTSATWRSSSRS